MNNLAKHPQTITSPSGEEMVVLPRAEYDRLIEAATDAEDARDANDILARIEDGREGFLPHDVVMRMRKENRVKVLREHRGLTQKELADRTGLSALYISQIETGRANGGRIGLEKIAQALGVELAMIMSSRKE